MQELFDILCQREVVALTNGGLKREAETKSLNQSQSSHILGIPQNETLFYCSR